MPPLPKQDTIPTIQHEDNDGRNRAMTASTTSTAKPPKLDNASQLDLGGDFGSMFNSLDKRASMQAMKHDAQRPIQPPPLNIEKVAAAKASPTSESSQTSNDDLLGPGNQSPYGRLPPAPKHQPSFECRNPRTSADAFEDEDAKLLADSVAVNRFLSSAVPEPSRNGRYRRGEEEDDDFDITPKKQFISNQFAQEDNMFAGTTAATSRYATRNHTNARPASPPRTKVMTPAEFERFKQEKEREGLEKMANRMKDDDDDEDEIDYDDDEDEEDKAREQVKQRRKQAATMQAYRQQMMKTTGNPTPSPPPQASLRPAFAGANSAPQLGHLRTPSADQIRRMPVDDDEEDEDVPLAILQAHGFPHKNRSAPRLGALGSTSNPNLRASAMLQPGRPASVIGEPSNHSQNRNQRHSTLPAFARGLPQDPFVGAGVSNPAARESLGMGIGQNHLQPPQQPAMHPGGLVGVIASEERSRAMRRGSPNLDTQRTSMQPGFDPINGIPSHMMYSGGGHFGMAGGNQPGQPRQQPQQQSQQQRLSTGEQAQLQMTQNMQQFMQMQMQFMQMMAANQNGGMPPQMQMPMPQQGQQQLYNGQMLNPQSMADFGSGQSMLGVNSQSQRPNSGARTMSMIQPSSASFMQPSGFGGPGAGYTPSIAPSERSNIGLPGRYRPVSQGVGSLLNAPSPKMHQRSNTMSGALSGTLSGVGGNESFMDKPTLRVSMASTISPQAVAVDDDDDEEGWAAMRAKREQKKSTWKWKKEEY